MRANLPDCVRQWVIQEAWLRESYPTITAAELDRHQQTFYLGWVARAA